MKIIILGLDGATWAVLKPLSDTGFLPNIKRLIEHGCMGVLKSTIPPMTSPAWPCLATGVNPGKIGAFSTLMRIREEDFRLIPVNSSVYRGNSFWDMLSRKGYRVALVKIPFLYPVYEINGVMVSGFGGTGKTSVYPRDLYRKVISGPSKLLEIKLFNKLAKLNVNNLTEASAFIEDVKNLAQEESKVVLELVQDLSWDILFYVLSATDWMQHAFMDKILEVIMKLKKGEYSDLSKLDRQIIEFYQLIDRVVGQFVNLIESDGEHIFFIVSDHGFTVRPFTFNIAKWLVENGYMKLITDQSKRDLINIRLFNLLKAIATEQLLKVMPTKLLEFAEKLFIKLSSKTVLGISKQIDFKNSRAFCLEDSAIYVNTLVNDENTLEGLISQLKNFLENNYSLKLEAFKCKEIYKGDKTTLAPDLIIKICDKNFIWEKSTDLNKPLVFKPNLPGIHNSDGIFLAYGPQIKEGYAFKKPLEIYDVAPTILHVFGCTISTSIDGKVLSEIFRDNSPYAKSFTARESEREFIRRQIRHKLSKIKSSKSRQR